MGTKFVPNLTNDVLDNFFITYQESGWMNQEILPQYVDKVFLKELEKSEEMNSKMKSCTSYC